MKTKITLSIAGLFLGLALFMNAPFASAAESSTAPAGNVISQTDITTLQTSLNTLRIVLNQLDGYLKSGQVVSADYVKIGSVLSSAQANLSALSGSLMNVSVLPVNLSVNLAKPEIKVVPEPAQVTQIGLDQNDPSIAPLSEEAPVVAGDTQANLFSVLTPKIVTGVVLGIGLIAVVIYSLRKKTKAGIKTDAETVNNVAT